MIARCLDVELHSLVPFLIDGFVFAMPGSGAHESHRAPSCLRRKMTYPQKKRSDRYGLVRLEQVQRAVAICVEVELVKMLKQKCRQHFRPWEAKGDFFSQAPCISQAPFHAPIRRGCRGGGRLSKTHCSDTTQSLQVVLER